MNCRNFETTLGELARGQMTEAALRDQALAHTEDCQRCARRLADEQTLSAGLHVVAADSAGQEAPARVEAALLAAFRQRETAAPVAPVSSIKGARAQRLPRWAVAAAAAVLIVAGLTVPRIFNATVPGPEQLAGRVEREERAGRPSAPASFPDSFGENMETESAPELTPASVSQNVAPRAAAYTSTPRYTGRMNGVARGLASIRPGKNRAAATAGTEEIATDYLPLSYESGLTQMDDGQVVRVELPRSALQSFGLPVNMERANERVKADVLLGNDGMARAIRFVR
ncbi:MAG TPA: hypothetical protein VF723_01135 [Pyrinomonadaceae bacterium]|jgi:anti-sigma factor RsiW